MGNLPLYNPDAKCPKCGHEDIYTAFHGKGDCTFLCVGWLQVDIDYLNRHCRRCSYGWLEAPLDQEKFG